MNTAINMADFLRMKSKSLQKKKGFDSALIDLGVGIQISKMKTNK